MHKWNGEEDFPAVITIFSAPNYCDVYNNKGAFIKFEVIVYTILLIISRTIHLTYNNLTIHNIHTYYQTLWIYSVGHCLLLLKRLWKCYSTWSKLEMKSKLEMLKKVKTKTNKEIMIRKNNKQLRILKKLIREVD